MAKRLESAGKRADEDFEAGRIVGLEGLVREDVRLGGRDEFWKLIADRRREPTIGRAALEHLIRGISQSE